eukprot:scaffold3139_cov214-Chaetoceros_neogracile.AAC.1
MKKDFICISGLVEKHIFRAWILAGMRATSERKDMKIPNDSRGRCAFSYLIIQLEYQFYIMQLTILATLIASAAAFAPSQVAQTSTALNAFESELG